MTCYLTGLEYTLPATKRTNEELVSINPEWDAEQIFAKTGIRSRHVVAEGETAGDLAFRAAETLLKSQSIDMHEIDAIVVGTQSPDYFLPGMACVLQDRLGLQQTCGAFDFNLGCSGFTYGLWLARALICSGSARRVLLVSTDTYSRYCDVHDLATVTLFGDGAGAVLISQSSENGLAEIGPTVVGTDGAGRSGLIVQGGAGRDWAQPAGGSSAARPRLHMNGPDVFRFALREIKPGIESLLARCELEWESVDLFLMHQANAFLLEHVRSKLGVPAEKMPVDVEETGNTVNASLPILMGRCIENGILSGKKTCVLAGFGVGFSWGMTLLKWFR